MNDKHNNQEQPEHFFTREDGLKFTKIIFKPVYRDMYEATFKCSKGGMTIDTTISGQNFVDCMIKVEKFLCSELEYEEYEVLKKK